MLRKPQLSSDAFLNLISAVRFIVNVDCYEVGICMHENMSDDSCLIMPGVKSRKLHTSRRDAFKVVTHNYRNPENGGQEDKNLIDLREVSSYSSKIFKKSGLPKLVKNSLRTILNEHLKDFREALTNNEHTVDLDKRSAYIAVQQDDNLYELFGNGKLVPTTLVITDNSGSRPKKTTYLKEINKYPAKQFKSLYKLLKDVAA